MIYGLDFFGWEGAGFAEIGSSRVMRGGRRWARAASNSVPPVPPMPTLGGGETNDERDTLFLRGIMACTFHHTGYPKRG